MSKQIGLWIVRDFEPPRSIRPFLRLDFLRLGYWLDDRLRRFLRRLSFANLFRRSDGVLPDFTRR